MQLLNNLLSSKPLLTFLSHLLFSVMSSFSQEPVANDAIEVNSVGFSRVSTGLCADYCGNEG